MFRLALLVHTLLLSLAGPGFCCCSAMRGWGLLVAVVSGAEAEAAGGLSCCQRGGLLGDSGEPSALPAGATPCHSTPSPGQPAGERECACRATGCSAIPPTTIALALDESGGLGLWMPMSPVIGVQGRVASGRSYGSGEGPPRYASGRALRVALRSWTC